MTGVKKRILHIKKKGKKATAFETALTYLLTYLYTCIRFL